MIIEMKSLYLTYQQVDYLYNLRCQVINNFIDLNYSLKFKSPSSQTDKIHIILLNKSLNTIKNTKSHQHPIISLN